MSTEPASTASRAEQLVLLLLGGVTLALLAEQALLLPAVIPKNYVEGWNAFHTLRAFGPEPLYPPIDAITSNNYPPLSFYLVGALGAVLGDNIIAGRLVSFVSLLAVAVAIALIVLRSTASRSAAVFAGMLFAGYALTRFENYVAMNDPQWLAHAIMTWGFLLFLSSRQQGLRFASSIVVLLIAGLVKHNLLAVPLAITLWMFWDRRPGRAAWLGGGAVALAATLLGLYAAFGSDFYAGLLAAPRAYEPEAIALKLNSWLSPMLLLVAAWMLLAAADRERADARLVSWYVATAAITGAVFLGGAGVGYNALFDLLIALSLAAGLAVHRLTGARAAGAASFGRAGAMLLLAMAVFVAAPAGLLKGWWAVKRIETDRAAVAAEIAFLASREGPAVCEELALCYWAGKESGMDVFNAGQKWKTGAFGDAEAAALFDGRRFAVIQIENANGRTARLPNAVNDRIHERYRIVRKSRSGAFLIPRQAKRDDTR